MLQSIGDIVSAYKKTYRPSLSMQMQFYGTHRSLAEAVETAALARLPGRRRHPHQRRIAQAVLHASKNSLLGVNLESCKTFSELHERVKTAISDISGIGELTIYDTALRIGAYLRLEPELIYLHAGVRDGVKALGLNHGLHTLEKSQLPRQFHSLRPCEIEDCLCIYKKELRGKETRRKAGCATSRRPLQPEGLYKGRKRCRLADGVNIIYLMGRY